MKDNAVVRCLALAVVLAGSPARAAPGHRSRSARPSSTSGAHQPNTSRAMPSRCANSCFTRRTPNRQSSMSGHNRSPPAGIPEHQAALKTLEQLRAEDEAFRQPQTAKQVIRHLEWVIGRGTIDYHSRNRGHTLLGGLGFSAPSAHRRRRRPTRQTAGCIGRGE